MSVTAGTLTTRISYELKDTGNTQWALAELYVYINQAVRAIMRRISETWPDYWLRTTQAQKAETNLASGTANYNLPTSLYSVVMVTTMDSTGDTTKREPLTLERTLDADADGYYLKDDDIYLYPTPAAAVTKGLVIYYLLRPTEVDAPATAVPLSDDFEDWITAFAVIKAKARQEEKTADFAAFYKMVDDDLMAHVTRTNFPGDDAGMHVEYRNWI